MGLMFILCNNPKKDTDVTDTKCGKYMLYMFGLVPYIVVVLLGLVLFILKCKGYTSIVLDDISIQTDLIVQTEEQQSINTSDYQPVPQ
jgi:hypothetical protein